jgi:hypothetical protein
MERACTRPRGQYAENARIEQQGRVHHMSIEAHGPMRVACGWQKASNNLQATSRVHQHVNSSMRGALRNTPQTHAPRNLQKLTVLLPLEHARKESYWL